MRASEPGVFDEPGVVNALCKIASSLAEGIKETPLSPQQASAIGSLLGAAMLVSVPFAGESLSDFVSPHRSAAIHSLAAAAMARAGEDDQG